MTQIIKAKDVRDQFVIAMHAMDLPIYTNWVQLPPVGSFGLSDYSPGPDNQYRWKIVQFGEGMSEDDRKFGSTRRTNREMYAFLQGLTMGANNAKRIP